MKGELTRLGQRVWDFIVILKVLQNFSSYVKGIISLSCSDGRLPSEDTDLKPQNTCYETQSFAMEQLCTHPPILGRVLNKITLLGEKTNNICILD